MFATQMKKFLDQMGIHFSWFMAAIAFLVIFFSSASLATPGILMVEITKDLGWSIGDVSLAIGVLFLTVALAAPFGAALMAIIGLTKVVVISGGLVILGLATLNLAFEKWHLLVGIGFFLGLSSGVLGLGFAATLATRWFDQRRGLVLGILASAFAAGQLVLIPLIAWIVETHGWRYGVYPPSIGCFICIVLFLLFGRNWPSELGICSYGGEKNSNDEQPVGRNNPFSKSLSVLTSSAKHPGFWLLASTFFICGLTSNGLISQHFIPFCADINIGIVLASSYLALMGVFNFIGATSSGWLTDRFNNYNLLAIYYGFRGLSLVYLPYSSLDAFSLTLWAIFFGFDFIATIPPTARLSASFFGKIDGPIAFAWIFASHQLGAAAAAYGAGEARDAILSYGPIFVTAGIACFVATGLSVVFKSYGTKLARG